MRVVLVYTQNTQYLLKPKHSSHNTTVGRFKGLLTKPATISHNCSGKLHWIAAKHPANKPRPLLSVSAISTSEQRPTPSMGHTFLLKQAEFLMQKSEILSPNGRLSQIGQF